MRYITAGNHELEMPTKQREQPAISVDTKKQEASSGRIHGFREAFWKSLIGVFQAFQGKKNGLQLDGQKATPTERPAGASGTFFPRRVPPWKRHSFSTARFRARNAMGAW